MVKLDNSKTFDRPAFLFIKMHQMSNNICRISSIQQAPTHQYDTF